MDVKLISFSLLYFDYFYWIWGDELYAYSF